MQISFMGAVHVDISGCLAAASCAVPLLRTCWFDMPGFARCFRDAQVGRLLPRG
jgi:hypothetical protein